MTEKNICRIAVIASSLPRLTRIMSLLVDEQINHHDDYNLQHILLQYLPCVAQFDQYRNESTQEWIPYLVNVDYHPELLPPSDVTLPTNLLDLANQQGTISNETEAKDGSYFPIITNIVIGNGIDNDTCSQHIQSYFQTLFSIDIPIHTMEPSPPYTTLSDELQAFQALSPEEKEVKTRNGTMGPGKMVYLIRTVGQTRIQEWLFYEQLQREEEMQRLEQLALEQQNQPPEEEEEEEHVIDPNKVRYACRICRNILFGQDDLIEHNAKASSKPCQSYFLLQSLPWMKPKASSSTNQLDNDLRETLGRLVCQKCQAKLGTWNWSGTPCSCGAWVVPAFQFPKSKIDAVPPLPSTSMNASLATTTLASNGIW
ncbi:dual specificity phosphatase 12 [Fistulifera solaris]|uniref:protein-tyrosine-phosphatase n=1 Tax=Fistulifera solaris TaxID=1519565 RepID=A0A1Z5KPW1_FISSO|nr:dual specificity phosphatase 12 [Fistulifera solaris]|eukprot:GAX28142.1 dual specificity phosphatase 12 [Fistulifera solaris]